MQNTVVMKAYAKINLGLDVLGRRENGYHDVKMVMQMVDLYDELTMEIIEEDAIIITTNVEGLEVDESNLVYKAIHKMKEQYHISQGVKVHLEKNIPIAAGMAGGSSDCATALLGTAQLFGLDVTTQDLMDIGVTLGADVPYCVMKKTALSEGIGEILTELKPMPFCYILVAKPPISVSTKFVYEHLDAKENPTHPDIDAMVDAIANESLKDVTQCMGNILEEVTIPEYPVIEEIKNIMKENGAMNALMSGSGPTVFGIFDHKEKAETAKKAVEASGLANQIHLTTPINE